MKRVEISRLPGQNSDEAEFGHKLYEKGQLKK